MQRRHLLEFASVCLPLLVFCGPARADLIEFTFAGEIEIVEGLVPPPWDRVEVGSPWEVRYVFDSEAEDGDTSPLFGEYDMLYAQVTIAGQTLFSNEGEIDVNFLNQELLYIFNDIGDNGISGAVALLGNSGSLPDDSLPPTLDLEDFSTSYLQLVQGGEWIIEGETLSFSSQIIPTPLTSLPLFAMFALRSRRRR